MKAIATLAALCLVVGLTGCKTDESTSVSPAAVSECPSSCETDCSSMKECDAPASPGAVGDSSECPYSGKSDASPGAVSDSPGCEKTKSSCSKTSDTSLGAVSDSSSCSKSKTSCDKK
jgi:hypothetical protein